MNKFGCIKDKFDDSSKIRNLLGWKPPWTLEEGIREMVRGIEK